MALGKKLNNLLGDYFGDETVSLAPQTNTESQHPESAWIREIPIHSIEVSAFQTRKKFDFEKIQALAQSIKQHGLIHPIIVLQQKKTESTEEKYIVLAGERRLRATKLLDQPTILAIVKTEDQLSVADQAMITAAENLQREDLNPIELAKTFEMLITTQETDENSLADMVGKSVQYIKNYLRLLTLPVEIQKMLIDDELSEGQARQLVPLPPESQLPLAQLIVEKRLTVKEITALLKEQQSIQSTQTESLPNTELETDHSVLQPNTPTRFSSAYKHNLPVEVIKKADKLAQIFPNSTLKCVGDENYGKIVITWKKTDQGETPAS